MNTENLRFLLGVKPQVFVRLYWKIISSEIVRLPKTMAIPKSLCSILGAGLLTTAGGMIPLNRPLPAQFLVIPGLASAQAATPLSQSLYGKPVVVVIYAKWCSNCQAIAPTLTALRKEYGERIHYITFDVSTRTTALKSAALADNYGLSTFFDSYKARTSTVAVFDPLTGHIVKLFRNNRNLVDYRQIIEKQLVHQDGESI
jgi:thiol-disulfide isomerase/thioredoxin